MIPLAVIAYLVGLWLGPFLSQFPLSLLGALLAFGIFLSWREQRGVLSLWGGTVLFFTVIVGLVQGHWTTIKTFDTPLAFLETNHPILLNGVVTAPVRHTPDGLILLLEAKSILSNGKLQPLHGQVRLVWRDPKSGTPVLFNDDVSVMARWREPYGTLNPGGFHYGHYLKHKGIDAVATVYGPNAVVPAQVSNDHALWASMFRQVDQWRQAIHGAAVDSLSPPALGLFLGMIVGEQSYIDQDIRDAFMATGTVHILSISGSHLGLLAFVVFGGTRWAIRQLPASWLEYLSIYLTATQCAVVCMLPVVTFYMLLAGAEMPTVRSWIMILVGCAGVWVARERNVLTALALAAVVMLLPHPEAIHNLSFQLSFLSVAAIGVVVLARRQDNSQPSERTEQKTGIRDASCPWWSRLWEKWRLAWMITLAVSLTTLPLVAYYFHQIPWLGLLANMLIVPLVGIVVIPLGLLTAVGVLVSGVNFLPLGIVNQWILEALAQMVVGLAQVPGAHWHVASPSIGSILLFWSVLAGGWLLKQQPRLRWSCIITTMAILVWWAWSPRTNWEPGQLRITFLDVGQGDATLLELPDGHTVLIDGGPAYRRLDMGRAVIGPYLWNQGIHRIDHMVATHPQWDHVGGLPWLIQSFDVETYWSNGVSRSKAFYKQLQTTVQEAELEEQIIGAGSDIIASGHCSLSVLSPVTMKIPTTLVSTHEISGTELNDRSLVTRLDCGAHSLLFTADVEQQALEHLQYLPGGHSANVIKVPHHGAKSSLHQGWVNRIDAQAMVVSVGSHNRYGHPASEVMAAYGARGIPMYRTDRDGAIIIEASLDSPNLRITTAKQQQLVPVVLNENFLRDEWANWQRLWN